MEGFPFVVHRFNITAERMETSRDPESGVRSITLTSSSGTETNKRLEEAVGRILYPEGWRSFIWAARHHAARAANPGASPTQGGMRGQTTLGPPIRPCSAWGLPCPLRFRRGGALLPHPFTLTPGQPGAVYSLRHFPSRCHGRALPGMPPVVESGPSSETEASANSRLLQPRPAYQLFVLSREREFSEDRRRS